MIKLRTAVRAALDNSRARSTLGGVSIATLCAVTSTTPAFAADKPDDGLQEIIVSGYRASLQSAQEIKKESDVVGDSITAADIGALPDRSVSETLQRIPGVVINRFSAGVDPDHFSVEGSGVTIRGLSYIHSEFNGRESFSANNGRALSFADVPSELLMGVDVFKSPSADRIEGGIGGVVNLRTRTPFDSKGFVVAGSLDESYGDFEKKHTPAGSVLISDRWATGVGELGVLGSVSYSQLKSRADKLQISNFAKRGLNPSGNLDSLTSSGGVPAGDQAVYMPRGAVGGSQEFDRTRRGYSGALQWRSPSERWEALAQFVKTDAREAWTEHTTEIATDNVAGQGDSQRVPGTTLSFDNTGLFSSGYITGASTGWRQDQNGPDPRTPNHALQSNNIMRGVNQKYVTTDTSAHVKWKPTDSMQFDLDYQHVSSTVDNLDATLWTSSYQDAFIGLNGSSMPYVMFQPPVNCNAPCATTFPNANYPYYLNGVPSGSHSSYADPFNSFYRSSMDHIEKSDGTQNALRLDGTFDVADNNWIKSIKTGYRHSDRDQTTRFSTYNWGVLSEQWGNGGPVWLDDPINGNANKPLSSYVVYNFPNFMKGAAPSPFGSQGRLYYSGNPAQDYGSFVTTSNLVQQTWQTVNPTTGRNQGWNALNNRAGVIPGTPFLPSEINPIEEKNNAVYLMANLAHNMDNGYKLTGNVGIRYTTTDREAAGAQTFLAPSSAYVDDATCATQTATAAMQVPPQLPTPFCMLSIADRQALRNFSNGARNETTEKVRYSYVLPSINLKLDVGDGWQYRWAYFKGISAPDIGYERNFYNVSGGGIVVLGPNGLPNGQAYLQGSATAGNPRVLPTTSDNYDFTIEWYFSKVGQLTMAMFYKELHGVVTNGIERLDLRNNGTTMSVLATTPTNSRDTGKIRGVEFGYQQTFDSLPSIWSGLGVSANYTYVGSSGVRQTTLSNTDPDVAAGRVATIDTSMLPLQGLSKSSFNITPFYQKGDFEARLAYNWRSRFLLTPRDVIVPYQPIINEDFGSLDASAFYSINSHIKLGMQIANLTNAVTKTSAVINDTLQTAPRGFYVNDRRYTLNLRWNFE